MFLIKRLAIRGYQQMPVPNTFFQQNEPAEHAAVIFSGLGYTCQGPVLSYPAFELLARWADVLQVEYNTRRSESHREEVEDAIAACQALLSSTHINDSLSSANHSAQWSWGTSSPHKRFPSHYRLSG